MKKSSVFVFLSFLLVFSIIGLASAAEASQITKSVDNFFTKVVAAADPILKWTLGEINTGALGDKSAGELLFVKFLIFLLMLLIIHFAVSKVPNLNNPSEEWIVWVISTVVAILGARFLSTQALVEFVWLPSGVVGIALACLIPFVIYFFFVQNMPGVVMRKICWIFFIILFIALAAMRWKQLTPAGGTSLGWIYVATAGVSLLVFYFDKTIHAWFVRSAMEKASEVHRSNDLNKINGGINYCREVLSTPLGAALPVWSNLWGANPMTSPSPKTHSHDVDAERAIKSYEKAIKRVLTT